MTYNPTIDRCRGTLLGLAIGDALGAAVEFQRPGTFPPVLGYRDGGPHGLAAGEWTDDTSMALALGDSLVNRGWDLADQARRYVAWWREGAYSITGSCFDIGLTVVGALERFSADGDPLLSGDPSERASGNGSIMRLAPVPIRYSGLLGADPAQIACRAEESSLPTHASPQCLSACRYFALVLSGLIEGVSRDEVLSPEWEVFEREQAREPLHPAILAVALGSFREKGPPEIRGSGYVVESLEAALWAFSQAADAREAILAAVNLGHDADTTGAVCGQLAGACWGESGLPAEWRDQLCGRNQIDRVLDPLIATRGN